MCVLTVSREMQRSREISRFVRPAMHAAATSASRGVSDHRRRSSEWSMASAPGNGRSISTSQREAPFEERLE